MFVLEVVAPGTVIQAADRNWAFQMNGLLEFLVMDFTQATVALDQFKKATFAMDAHLLATAAKEHFFERQARSRAIQADLPPVPDRSIKALIERIVEVDLRYARDERAEGRLSQRLLAAGMQVNARAFIFAVDAFYMKLLKISKYKDAPKALGQIATAFKAAFPDLKGIRDSSAHADERMLGEQYGKAIMSPRIDTPGISSPGGPNIIVADNFEGSKFSTTLADGTYGSIDVDESSLFKVHEFLTTVLNAFTWDAGGKSVRMA